MVICTNPVPPNNNSTSSDLFSVLFPILFLISNLLYSLSVLNPAYHHKSPLMEPVINLNEQRQTQAKVTVCSHPSVGSQSSTSVGTTPVGHESSLLPPTTPEVRMLPCQQNQVSAPEEVQKFANPAPLGLCAFALTSFVSNCMNISMVRTKTPGIDTALALTYGGVVQLLAGMWYVGSCLDTLINLDCVYVGLIVTGKWRLETPLAQRPSARMVVTGLLLPFAPSLTAPRLRLMREEACVRPRL